MRRFLDWFWMDSWFKRWAFWSHRSNWHSHPWISPIMCKLGRHDYEPYLWENDRVWMECFYCLHRKSSTCRNINTRLH